MTNGDGSEMPEWTRFGIAIFLFVLFLIAAVISWDRYCELSARCALVDATERVMLRQVEMMSEVTKGFSDPLPCER
jgi:hypothetical protein